MTILWIATIVTLVAITLVLSSTPGMNGRF